ncbi:MAG: hypothetical protein WC869_01695 [Phycisphaerae bacterium]|jgi:hypothetical protein
MAAYTYEQLKEMKVTVLRDIAKELQHESLEGHSTMHKEQLLPLLCKVMGIHTHQAARGARKTRIKGLIHRLQKERDAAIASREVATLPDIRQQIHALKHRLRRMAEQKA